MFEKNRLFRHFGCKQLQVPGESVHVEPVQDAHHNNRHQGDAEITIQYNYPQQSRDVRVMFVVQVRATSHKRQFRVRQIWS